MARHRPFLDGNVEIKLSRYSQMLLAVMKEHLNQTDTDIVEEAIAHLFDEYQAVGKIPEMDVPAAPRSLMEVMQDYGLLDD